MGSKTLISIRSYRDSTTLQNLVMPLMRHKKCNTWTLSQTYARKQGNQHATNRHNITPKEIIDRLQINLANTYANSAFKIVTQGLSPWHISINL